MVLPYRGSARTPGVVGIAPLTWGAHTPGPLNFKQVSSPQTSLAKSSRSLPMPPPWHSSTHIRVRVLDWKLSSGDPATTDVKQGGLPNCPIAAVLAALAHTDVGRKYLNGLITEHNGPAVKTVLPKDLIEIVEKNEEGEFDLYSHQDAQLVSNRFFSVKLGKSPDVHDTFYVGYVDSKNTADLELVFMGSPKDVLWPAVIEKACALHYGSYTEIGRFKDHPANEFWAFIMGAEAQRFEVKDSTDIESIRDVVRNAGTIPTIAASREKTKMVDITGWHGFAVMGLKGKNIELYDPAKTKVIAILPDDFRSNFQMMLYGNPAS